MFHQVSWVVWCFFAFLLIALVFWSFRSVEYIFRYIPSDAEEVSLNHIKQQGANFSLFRSLDLNHGPFVRYRNMYIFKTRFIMYGVPRGMYAFLLLNETHVEPKMTTVYPMQQKQAENFYKAKISKFALAELERLYKVFGINRYSLTDGIFAEENQTGILVVVAGEIKNSNAVHELQGARS